MAQPDGCLINHEISCQDVFSNLGILLACLLGQAPVAESQQKAAFRERIVSWRHKSTLRYCTHMLFIKGPETYYLGKQTMTVIPVLCAQQKRAFAGFEAHIEERTSDVRPASYSLLRAS